MKRKVLIEKFKENNIFYVYIYFDTRKIGEYIYFDDRIKLELKFDYEPFYVGKGFGKRMNHHMRPSNLKKNSPKNSKIKKIIKETGKIPIILKFKFNMTEKDALALEKKIVALIGRKNIKTGQLTNLTDAGKGTSGYVFTDEIKEKMSIAQKNSINSNRGKKMSEDFKNNQRLNMLGDKNPMYNKKQNTFDKAIEEIYDNKKSEEIREKLKKSHTGNKASEETLKNMSEAQKTDGSFQKKIMVLIGSLLINSEKNF